MKEDNDAFEEKFKTVTGTNQDILKTETESLKSDPPPEGDALLEI